MRNTVCLLLLAPAFAGTLVGRMGVPSGVGVGNATLSLTLSQAAAVPGSFALVPQAVSCATSLDGSVVGLPNPLPAPVVSALAGSGTLAAGNYFVVYSYSGLGGETLKSPETAVVLTGAGAVQVAPPTRQPAGASWDVYIGTSSGGETRQYAGSFATYTQTAGLSAGAALPATNSTVCSLTFNDATVPAPTYYVATLSDVNGNPLPGYPQSWYLAGSTVDVSLLEPLSSNPALRFPSPILATPSSSQPQSVASALNLNGYPIQGTGNLGPGMYTTTWVGTLPAASATLSQWTPNVAVVVKRLSAAAQTAGAGGTLGATLALSDGSNTCSFSGLLGGAATFGSTNLGSGVCTFAAGVPLSVRLTSDDHGTRPGNVTVAVEMTAQ
ncbi:MAG: hypothetical protein ACYC6M_14060 [Terriglobales bacterium]